MKNETITYRGAAIEREGRIPPLQQKQQVKLVAYRGARGEVTLGHRTHREDVSYRGARGRVEL